MSSVNQPLPTGASPSAGVSDESTSMLRYNLARAGGLVIAILFIPAMVMLSAGAMISIFWPLFLGARIEYGFEFGTRTRESVDLWPEWWLLLFVWWGFLLIGTYTGLKYRHHLRVPFKPPKTVQIPRPRI